MTLKDIHDKLQGIEDAIVGGVHKVVVFPLWVKIVAGVGLLCLVLLLITTFKRNTPINAGDEQTMRAKDSVILYQQKYIDALQRGQAQKDSVIIRELGRITGNKAIQTRIIHDYENIDNNVRSLSRDSLRSAVEKF